MLIFFNIVEFIHLKAILVTILLNKQILKFILN
jgi:hypothetical protein